MSEGRVLRCVCCGVSQESDSTVEVRDCGCVLCIDCEQGIKDGEGCRHGLDCLAVDLNQDASA